MTVSTLRSYQRHLFHWRKDDGRKLSFISQSDRLAGVRRLFRWMYEQGHLEQMRGARIHLGTSLPAGNARWRRSQRYWGDIDAVRVRA